MSKRWTEKEKEIWDKYTIFYNNAAASPETNKNRKKKHKAKCRKDINKFITWNAAMTSKK